MDFAQLGHDAALQALGLTKVAKLVDLDPVEQYRLLRKGFQRGSDSGVLKGDVIVPQEGFATHDVSKASGPTGMRDVLESFEDSLSERPIIRPSTDVEKAQHGPGVYWWRGNAPWKAPNEPRYWHHSGSEGVITDLETLPKQLEDARNRISGGLDLRQMRTGPGEYPIRPQDHIVLDTAQRVNFGRGSGTEAKSLSYDTLKGMMDDAGFQYGPMDSAVHHSAYVDHIMQNAGKNISPTSEASLIDRFNRRLQGENIS